MAEKDKKKKSAEAGGNPNVPEGAFGGTKDTGMVERLFPELGQSLKGPSFFDPNLGAGNLSVGAGAGAEGGGDQRKLRELLATLFREQLAADQAAKSPEAYRERLQALSEYQDPVRLARERQEASLAAPFGPGGYFEGRRAADLYTPEQIVASGGMTAQNQLRSQQKKTDTFDPEELKRLNAQYRRTYM